MVPPAVLLLFSEQFIDKFKFRLVEQHPKSDEYHQTQKGNDQTDGKTGIVIGECDLMVALGKWDTDHAITNQHNVYFLSIYSNRPIVVVLGNGGVHETITITLNCATDFCVAEFG